MGVPFKWHLANYGAEVAKVDLLALGRLVLLVAKQPHVEVHRFLCRAVQCCSVITTKYLSYYN